ncbi:signal peptidase I [Kitasatospora sp. SUK 42]|uniref:signal peptidase I n=1 Tax=Kitasatospora sp. SUK 42 TaxID=1588882 RepID=UPI0018C9C8CC|nr:signal peptidase I [Kitasatospora sp. SUK 42]MBV2154080.1 signal peptidase I [Kitasatospora sp. SUK 42]
MAVNLPETPSGAPSDPAVQDAEHAEDATHARDAYARDAHGGPDAPGAPGGRAEARRRASGSRGRRNRRAGRKSRPLWIELPAMAAVGLVIALLIKTCLFQVFSIPSGSMENTLRIGDRVGVNKLAPLTGWKPEPGQPVVFKDPGNWLPPQPVDSNPFTNAVSSALSFVGLVPPKDDNYLVKRVIATGGQTVQCNGTTLTVDGKKVDEPYLHPGDDSCAGLDFGPVTVPTGYVWVEGDHRSDSADSRYHQRGPGGGAVPVDDVVGPVSGVVWPLNHLDWFGWTGR